MPVVSTQLLEANGTSLDRNQGDWRPLVGFVKDVRHPNEVVTYNDQGFGITPLMPWRGSDFVQRCTTSAREFQRGSYGFNGVMPLKP